MKFSYIDTISIYLALLLLAAAFVPDLRSVPEPVFLGVALAPLFGIQLYYAGRI